MVILVAGTLVLALDQCTKWMVRSRLTASVSLTPIVCIRQVRTVRASFTHRQGRISLAVGWVVAAISALVLAFTGAGLQTELSRLGVGVALGGAAGNLLDILRRGSVTDFIDFGWWPVFNLADVGIVAGLVLAFWPFG